MEVNENRKSPVNIETDVDVYVKRFYYRKLSDKQRWDKETLLVRNDLKMRENSNTALFASPQKSSQPEVVKLLPNFFVHIFNLNSNTFRYEEGPQNLTLACEEIISAGPLPHILLPLQVRKLFTQKYEALL